jgi:hypothetical protein
MRPEGGRRCRRVASKVGRAALLIHLAADRSSGRDGASTRTASRSIRSALARRALALIRRPEIVAATDDEGCRHQAAHRRPRPIQSASRPCRPPRPTWSFPEAERRERQATGRDHARTGHRLATRRGSSRSPVARTRRRRLQPRCAARRPPEPPAGAGAPTRIGRSPSSWRAPGRHAPLSPMEASPGDDARYGDRPAGLAPVSHGAAGRTSWGACPPRAPLGAVSSEVDPADVRTRRAG